jgi:aminomuconate-semialdehyde/2-hydroxymuconate-6-semialdehyde dehydrogenase
VQRAELVTHFIDGKSVESLTGDRGANVNPWTREVQSEVARGTRGDVQLAVAGAMNAFDTGPWPRMTFQQRGTVLVRLAELIETHGDELAMADTTDMGRPLVSTRGNDVARAATFFRFFADHARLATGDTYPTDATHHAYSRFEPAGVVGSITPWNFPLLLASLKVAPALAWGNTVVLKPAEDTPTSAHVLAELAVEAGLPSGALNVVQGTGAAGRALTASPDVDRLTFTGATATGRQIARAAADNLVPVSLELGGKGANLVFADADLDAAVEWSVKAIFSNSGQVCLAGSRIYVQQSIFADFTARLVAAADALRVGDPMDPETQLGPLASAAHFARVSSYFDRISSDGGEVLTGGAGRGWTFRPTVVTGLAAESSLCTEEIFGPLAVVQPFDDEQQAVELANSSSYGLTALAFTRDLARAHRVAAALRAGTVWVNCFSLRDLRAPFGGLGFSGVGRDGGLFSRDFFTEPKAVTMELGGSS